MNRRKATGIVLTALLGLGLVAWWWQPSVPTPLPELPRPTGIPAGSEGLLPEPPGGRPVPARAAFEDNAAAIAEECGLDAAGTCTDTLCALVIRTRATHLDSPLGIPQILLHEPQFVSVALQNGVLEELGLASAEALPCRRRFLAQRERDSLKYEATGSWGEVSCFVSTRDADVAALTEEAAHTLCARLLPEHAQALRRDPLGSL